MCILVSGIAIWGAHKGPHAKAEGALEGGLKGPWCGPLAADKGLFLEAGAASALASFSLAGNFIFDLRTLELWIGRIH